MADGPKGLMSDFTCRVCSPPENHGGSISIRSGVGDWPPPRCHNYPDDVRQIQLALNRFSPNEGGPNPPLSADGVIGPKTKAAIYHFQRVWDIHPDGVGGTKPADGVVDMRGHTIQRLSGGPGRPIDLPAEVLARIPRAMQIIGMVGAVLPLAKQHFAKRGLGGLPSLQSANKLQADKLDRHFHLSKTRDPVDRVNRIEKIFQRMKTVIGFPPMAQMAFIDEPPDRDVGAFMYTSMGGFHRKERNNPDNYWPELGLWKGNIYLCPKSRLLGQEAFAYAIIHELAHFVGPTADYAILGTGIDDWAYFRKDPIKYRNLSPDEAIWNADTYSMYAFEVIGKPDFSPVQ